MQLTEHFTFEELVRSDVATRRGIPNDPSDTARYNLGRVASKLEEIRAACGGGPLVVSSGYRCPALNMAIGGSRTSAHMRGLAADFHVPGLTLAEAARRIVAAGIVFDQLIFEGTWLHVGLAEANATPRQEELTATFHGGTAVYSKGIDSV